MTNLAELHQTDRSFMRASDAEGLLGFSPEDGCSSMIAHSCAARRRACVKDAFRAWRPSQSRKSFSDDRPGFLLETKRRLNERRYCCGSAAALLRHFCVTAAEPRRFLSGEPHLNVLLVSSLAAMKAKPSSTGVREEVSREARARVGAVLRKAEKHFHPFIHQADRGRVSGNFLCIIQLQRDR
ncbi:hypothetical protein FQA47_018257 [Oryzias melastigma]|uniref:Uncharacterized protein n=1 Tax=Oryzias melastigma TaxID=30732 RepID=A0A834L2R6_ORYME|nr:hypothetical protein FQA47_018257 [Oryzias melastigma]